MRALVDLRFQRQFRGRTAVSDEAKAQSDSSLDTVTADAPILLTAGR